MPRELKRSSGFTPRELKRSSGFTLRELKCSSGFMPRKNIFISVTRNCNLRAEACLKHLKLHG